MRLWLLGEVKEIVEGLKGLVRVMVERADKEKDVLMPGYTHLQVLSLSFSHFHALILFTDDAAML